MKLTPKELLTACNGLLAARFPEIGVIGREVREGYEMPSFFTQIVWGGYERETLNFASGSASYVITYLDEPVDELRQLALVEEIQKVFELQIPVMDRMLRVEGTDLDYIGEQDDILQVTVRFSWREHLLREETAELMGTVEVDLSEDS